MLVGHSNSPRQQHMDTSQTSRAQAELSKLVANRRPGYSLDSMFYKSPTVFDLDMRAIFAEHWIFVGVEPDVNEPGDYFLADFGPYSVVIVRSDDEEIRAFHNVCRHR